MSEKKILDMTCGSRTIWFNKNHPNAVYCDKRRESMEMYFGKARTSLHQLNVDPDILCDFTALPFPDESFSLVVFDPPHLTRAKETAWLVKKYGKLDEDWPQMIHDGFAEGMRVLKQDGVMIEGGGKISDIEKVAIVHALGVALNLSKLDWALLAATSDFDTPREGVFIQAPAPKEDEE